MCSLYSSHFADFCIPSTFISQGSVKPCTTKVVVITENTRKRSKSLGFSAFYETARNGTARAAASEIPPLIPDHEITNIDCQVG